MATGESANADDSAVVDNHIEVAYEELNKYGTIEDSFTSNAIPDWAQDAMRDRVAFMVAPAFGLPLDRIAMLSQGAGIALAVLLRHMKALTATAAADITHKVLQKLGIIRQGEDAPPAHDKTVDDVSEAILDLLTEEGTLASGWTSLANIPEWAEPFMVNAIAYRSASLLGVTDPVQLQLMRLEYDEALAEIKKRNTALGETATKTILRNMILRKLRVIDFAENPSAAQIEVSEELLDKTFDQLRSEKTVTFTSAAIPDWAMVPLRNYMAYLMADTFKVPDVRIQRLFQEHRMGLKEIRALAIERAPLTTDPIKVKFY